MWAHPQDSVSSFLFKAALAPFWWRFKNSSSGPAENYPTYNSPEKKYKIYKEEGSSYNRYTKTMMLM